MVVYLGLDIGQKTIGISMSQSGIVANNYDTYRFLDNDYDSAIKYIIDLIKQLNVDIVVIGYPKHMNNDIGIKAKISEKFKENIEKNTNSKVVLEDERLSTKTVLKTLISANVSRKVQKKVKDELSAVIILQNYLDRINK